MESSKENQAKTGVVALIGPPNVGKSTLLNNLLGQKISIVSPKPQTTRNRIMGVVNGPDHQLLILDTPGVHRARSPLNLEMVKIALDTLQEVDAIIFMIDTSYPLPGKTNVLPEQLQKANKPVILLINKIDLSSREKLLPVLNAYKKFFPFQSMIPVSALTGDGVPLLLEELVPLMPTGPRLYPEDIPTDSTERFISAEIIREKIFLQTKQEIPYSTAVAIESFKEDEKSNLITIHATIYVERSSQKGIIIGRQGAMLKRIGKAARKDIQQLLGAKIMLKLWVKIRKDWTEDSRFLKEELGFG